MNGLRFHETYAKQFLSQTINLYYGLKLGFKKWHEWNVCQMFPPLMNHVIHYFSFDSQSLIMLVTLLLTKFVSVYEVNVFGSWIIFSCSHITDE